ncbi:MAG: hypothetical protein JXA21_14515, partial [Anaerolineae bacterium]|nr:hypothetical protein [Anaerolineae bacterium]
MTEITAYKSGYKPILEQTFSLSNLNGAGGLVSCEQRVKSKDNLTERAPVLSKENLTEHRDHPP